MSLKTPCSWQRRPPRSTDTRCCCCSADFAAERSRSYLSLYIYIIEIQFVFLWFPHNTVKLAHSRPPPVRTKPTNSSANTTPQHSPTDKHYHKHGAGRKSTNSASERKARPTSLYRRSTPHSGSSKSGGAMRSHREKERREDEDQGVLGESFPQFW